MKLYLAAPYAGRDIVLGHVPVYEQAGHEITCRWVNGTRTLGPETYGTSPASTDSECMVHAGWDLEDIDKADVLVHYTAAGLRSFDPTLGDATHNLHSGGRHVETGYALATHKSVVLLGAAENIFQRGLCHVCPTLPDVLDVLDEMSEDWFDDRDGDVLADGRGF